MRGLLARTFHFACLSTTHRDLVSTRQPSTVRPVCGKCGKAMTPIRAEERNAIGKILALVGNDKPGAAIMDQAWLAFVRACARDGNASRRAQIEQELDDERGNAVADLIEATDTWMRAAKATEKLLEALDALDGAFQIVIRESVALNDATDDNQALVQAVNVIGRDPFVALLDRIREGHEPFPLGVLLAIDATKNEVLAERAEAAADVEKPEQKSPVT